MKGFTPKWSVADFSSLISTRSTRASSTRASSTRASSTRASSTRASSTRTGFIVVPVFMMALILLSPLMSSIAVAATVHLEHPHQGEGETVAVAVSEPKSPVAFGNVRGNGVRGNMVRAMMMGNGNGVVSQRDHANMVRAMMMGSGNGVVSQRDHANMVRGNGVRGNMVRGKGMRAMVRGNKQVFNCLVSMYVEGGDASACHDSMHSAGVESHASFSSGGSAWFASPVLTNIPETKAQPQHIAYAEQYIPSVFLENSTPPPEQS